MLLPKSKGQKKKKAEEGRCIKLKEQTKEKTAFEEDAMKEYLEIKTFFPIFIF